MLPNIVNLRAGVESAEPFTWPLPTGSIRKTAASMPSMDVPELSPMTVSGFICEGSLSKWEDSTT